MSTGLDGMPAIALAAGPAELTATPTALSTTDPAPPALLKTEMVVETGPSNSPRAKPLPPRPSNWAGLKSASPWLTQPPKFLFGFGGGAAWGVGRGGGGVQSALVPV